MANRLDSSSLVGSGGASLMDQCRVVSGIECLAGVSREVRLLLLVGRGRKAQTWELVRLRGIVLAESHPEALDAANQTDKLVALAFSILWFCFQATVGRSKTCRRALSHLR